MGTLGDIINTYLRTRTRLNDAVRCGNVESVRLYDRRLISSWNELLDYQTQTREERIELASFLLDQLEPFSSSSESMEQISQKLLELVKEGN